MALVSIGPQTPSTQFAAESGEIFGKQTAYCWIKRAWNIPDEPWELELNLIPLRAEQASLPSVSQAKLLWRYGAIKDYWSQAFERFDQKKLRDLYVAIQVVNDDAPPYTVWAGVIPAEELAVHGSDRDQHGPDNKTPKGDQVIIAYGLEYLLDRRVLHEGVLSDGTRMPWAPTFNERQSQGLQVLGNRSNAFITVPPDPEVYGFGQGLDGDPPGDGPQVWSVKQIIEYLLHFTNSEPEDIHPLFRLGAPAKLLEFMDVLVDVVEQDGASVWAILKRLIDRRRGIGATVRWGVDEETDLPSGDVELACFALVDEDVVVRDRRLPKNENTFTKALDLDHSMPEAVVRLDETERYSQIIVQGARAISCFSCSQIEMLQNAHATMEPGWSAADEALYISALDDAHRKRDRFERVYQMYRLPKDFDFKTFGGRTLNPQFDENGLPDFSRHAPALNLGHKFLNWVPLPSLADVYYEELVELRYQRPAAYMQKLNANDNPSGNWIHLENPWPDPDGLGGEEARASLTMMDRDLTFKVTPSINHILGKHGFPDDAETQTAPVYAHRYLVATVAIEADTRPKVIVSEFGPATLPPRTLVLSVNDAQTWLVAPGTVVGLKPDHSLDVYNGPWAVDGEYTMVGCVRNDAARLREVAALAAAWYCKTRVAVEYALSGLWAGVVVGMFLKSVWDGSNSQEVNSAVTAVGWDFERQATTTRTGFIELDVVSQDGA